MSTNRPDILFIVTDQQHFRTLQSTGCPEARTPCLDRIASEGLSFQRHMVTNPVCQPSRGSIWTGLMPSATGLYCNGTNFPAARPRTFTEDLNDAGYTTGHFGKMHLVPCINRIDPHPAFGFREFLCGEGDQWLLHDDYNNWLRCNYPDEFLRHYQKMMSESYDSPHTADIPEYLTHSAWVTRNGCDFIRRHKDDSSPWFLSLGYFDPHHAFNPCEPYASQWSDAPVSAPRTNPDQWQDMPECMRNDFRQDLWADRPDYLRAVLRAYHAMVNHLDDCMGRVLEELESSGRLENTILVFTSDHGDFAGNHGRLFKGGYLMDDLLRVPLLVWSGNPRLRTPALIDDVTSSLDFFATMQRLAGSQAAPPPDSRPLFDATLQPLPDGPREFALSEWRIPPLEGPRGDILSIRTRNHRLTLYPNTRQQTGELYCHDEDPDELHNRFADPALASVREELTSLLLAKSPPPAAWSARETLW